MRIRDGYFSMGFAKFLFEHLRAAASEYFGYVNRHSTITKMDNRNESKHRLLCNFMIGLSVFYRYCKNGLIFLNVYLYGTLRSCALEYVYTKVLILSWRTKLSHRNCSNDLHSKSMDLFLYDGDLRHERINRSFIQRVFMVCLIKWMITLRQFLTRDFIYIVR